MPTTSPTQRTMDVAFVNENVLGHRSYLPRFIEALKERPELGIRPHVIDAFPLPAHLRLACLRVRGLARFGLDTYEARLRLVISWHARRQLEELRSRQTIDAAVVNTQFVGLYLTTLADRLPLLVSTDNTLTQAVRVDGWFGHPSRRQATLPLTLAPMRRRERDLFRRAFRLLPWAELVRQSMIRDYQLPPRQISVLPPSMKLPPRRECRPFNARPNILFVGSEFQRKGGPMLLECYRAHFAGRCELHVVTHADLPSMPGLHVHRDIVANSEAWLELWDQADIFVLPSSLDVVPNVLIEALAFEVAVVSSDVGAAREILAGGEAGLLLPRVDPEALRAAIEQILNDRAAARARSELGRRHAEAHFDLATNAARLAGWLHATQSDGARHPG